MFFIETKHCKKVISEYKTLFVSPQETVIQRMCPDEIIMYEVVIPNLFVIQESYPVSIKIDEHVIKLFEDNEVVMITGEYIQGLCEGLSVSYYWEHSDAMSWNTFFPQACCIMKIPEEDWFQSLVIDPRNQDKGSVASDWDQYTEIDISDNRFSLLQDKYTLSFPTLKMFQTAKGILSSEKLNEVFTENRGQVAAIYYEENYPLCLEFTGSRKVYIAPICRDST